MNFLKNIEKAGQGWLYFAQFEWQVIAAAIFVFTSERAIYYYGASSSDFERENYLHHICFNGKQ